MGHRSCPEPGHDSLLVIPLHVLVDRLRDFRIAAEVLFVSVIHLLLQLREQVLRLRVVQAVPCSRPGLDDAVLLKRRPVGRPLVLPALVRMEDPACRIGIFPVAGEHRTDVPFLPQSQHLLVVDRLSVPVL